MEVETKTIKGGW